MSLITDRHLDPRPALSVMELGEQCPRGACTGKGEGLRLWSYAAGHTIGGAVWRVAAHGEDIVYAVDFNHRKERHLNGAAIDSIVSRPAILITGTPL